MDVVDNVQTGDNVEDLNGENISENGNNLIDVEDENTRSTVNGRKRKKLLLFGNLLKRCLKLIRMVE